MAATHKWKVYKDKEYIANFKHPEDAAQFVSGTTGLCTIRYGHSWIVWVEGKEIQPAAESFDAAAATMLERVKERQRTSVRFPPVIPAARGIRP